MKFSYIAIQIVFPPYLKYGYLWVYLLGPLNIELFDIMCSYKVLHKVVKKEKLSNVIFLNMMIIYYLILPRSLSLCDN